MEEGNDIYSDEDALDEPTRARGGVKTGKFTDEESRFITSRLNEFMEDQGITVEELVPGLRANAKAGGGDSPPIKIYSIWKELATEMPTRGSKAIYQHGCRILMKDEQKPWTQEDKDNLLKMHEKYGNNWATIGRLLSKVGDDCKHMYTRLSSVRKKSGKWDDAENQALVNAVLGTVAGASTVNDIGNASINWNMVWDAMNKERTSVDYLRHWGVLIKKWKASGENPNQSGAGCPAPPSSSSSSSSRPTSTRAAAAAAVAVATTEDEAAPESGKEKQDGGKERRSTKGYSAKFVCYLRDHFYNNSEYKRKQDIVWAEVEKNLGMSALSRKYDTLAKRCPGVDLKTTSFQDTVGLLVNQFEGDISKMAKDGTLSPDVTTVVHESRTLSASTASVVTASSSSSSNASTAVASASSSSSSSGQANAPIPKVTVLVASNSSSSLPLVSTDNAVPVRSQTSSSKQQQIHRGHPHESMQPLSKEEKAALKKGGLAIIDPLIAPMDVEEATNRANARQLDALSTDSGSDDEAFGGLFKGRVASSVVRAMEEVSKKEKERRKREKKEKKRKERELEKSAASSSSSSSSSKEKKEKKKKRSREEAEGDAEESESERKRRKAEKKARKEEKKRKERDRE